MATQKTEIHLNQFQVRNLFVCNNSDSDENDIASMVEYKTPSTYCGKADFPCNEFDVVTHHFRIEICSEYSQDSEWIKTMRFSKRSKCEAVRSLKNALDQT